MPLTDALLYARVSTLMADYAVHVDAREAKQWAALFTDDGALEYGGRRVVGHAALSEFAAASKRGTHLGGSPTVSPTEDGLLVRSQFIFMPVDGSSPVSGSYLDRVIDDGERARFAQRSITLVSPAPAGGR